MCKADEFARQIHQPCNATVVPPASALCLLVRGVHVHHERGVGVGSASGQLGDKSAGALLFQSAAIMLGQQV